MSKRQKPTPETAPEGAENGDEENAKRFAYLLAPIRDLAENWNIDLAKVLETYLMELGEVVMSTEVEEEGRKMNFAEAALLIQGSTCVYSKKVEYLYQLCFKLVETLSRQRAMKDKQPQQNNAIDENGNDQDAESLLREGFDGEFVPFDDIAEAKDIDLDEDDEENRDHDSLIRPTMPLSLVPLEDFEKSAVQLESMDGQALGRRDDFWMNTAIVHPETGALLLDACNVKLLSDTQPRERFVPCGFGNQSLLLPPSPSRASSAPIAHSPNVPNNQQVADQTLIAPPVDNNATFTAVPHGFDDDHSVDNFDPLSPDTTLRPRRSMDRSKRFGLLMDGKPAKKRKTKKDLMVEIQLDAWDELELGEDKPKETGADFKHKPLKSGQFYRMPKIIRATDTVPDELLSDHFNNNIYSKSRKYPKEQWKKPNCAALNDLYWTERQRRIQALNRLRIDQQNQNTSVVRNALMAPKRQQSWLNGENPEGESILSGPLYELFDAPMNDDDDDDDEPPHEVNIGDGIPEAGDNFGADFNGNADIPITGSYEDMVRMRLERILMDAENNVILGDLARRVQEWEKLMEPVLLDEETRRKFNICEYRKDLIKFFDDDDGSEKDTEGRRRYEFADFARTQSKWEVCRYFLASLMLANMGNVELATKGEEGTEESINTLELMLLNRELHDELLDEYVAPSVRNN